MFCLRYEKHCTRNTSDAGSGLNDLKRGTKHIARSVSGTGKLTIGSGETLEFGCDSICIHGDAPTAVENVKALRKVLEEAGYEVAPF